MALLNGSIQKKEFKNSTLISKKNIAFLIGFAIIFMIWLFFIFPEFILLITGVFGISVISFLVFMQSLSRKKRRSIVLQGTTAKAIVINSHKSRIDSNRTRLSLRLKYTTSDDCEFFCSAIHTIFNHELEGFAIDKKLLVKIHPKNPNLALVLSSLSFEKDQRFTEFHLSDDEIEQRISKIAETNFILNFSGKNLSGPITNANYSGLRVNGNELWYFQFKYKNETIEASEIINRHYYTSLIKISGIVRDSNGKLVLIRDSIVKPGDQGIIISKDYPKTCAFRKDNSGAYVNSHAISCLVIIVLLLMVGLIVSNIIFL